MALGVVVALVGHIMGDRVIVGVGVAVIFLATLAMVIFAFAAYRSDDSDPRPRTSPYGVPGAAVGAPYGARDGFTRRT